MFLSPDSLNRPPGGCYRTGWPAARKAGSKQIVECRYYLQGIHAPGEVEISRSYPVRGVLGMFSSRKIPGVLNLSARPGLSLVPILGL